METCVFESEVKMFKFWIALTLVLTSSSLLAEQQYDPSFTLKLRSLSLEREAFLYALNWAGSGSSRAEYEVAESMINGLGILANPRAALVFACKSTVMSEYEVSRLVLIANLRLITEDYVAETCQNLKK